MSGRCALLMVMGYDSTTTTQEMEAKPCTERAWRIGKATTLNVGTLGLVSLRRTSYESWMASICLMTEKHDLGDA